MMLTSALFFLPLLNLQPTPSALPFETEADRRPRVVTQGSCLIQNARILTVTRGTLERGSILVQNGKIVAIGPNVTAPAGVKVIPAEGRVVSPGIVDAHIHRGADATNEGSDSITAECRILDVLNTSSANVWDAVASGETTGLVLHGSANAIGGQSVVVKLKYGRRPSEYVIPDAPRMIKFALGENVTRSGSTTSTRWPRTRMGVEALYRRAFEDARQYMATWEEYERSSDPNAIPPRKDLRLEALADILRGKIWVQCHSYRGDEMLMMAKLSKEYGFKIGALQHGLEGYKIAPELAKLGVGVSIFMDNWSFKIEGYDGIPYNAWLCTRAGVNTSINTDGTNGTTAVILDAAKTMRFGGLSEDEALALVTINPAKQLGIDHRTGSLEVGKDADLVIWSGHPLSVYSKPMMTMIEGEVYFERRDAFGVDAASPNKTKLSPIKPSDQEPLRIEPSRAYAFVGATLHPVSGPVIPKGTIILEDGKITALGANVAVPRGARVIRADGLHIYPGMIDAGNSIGLNEVSPVGQMVDNRELGNFQPDLRALTGLWMQSEHIPVARAGGITTLMSKPVGGTISGQSAVVHLNGWTADDMSAGVEALCLNFPDIAGAPVFDPSLSCCGLDDLGSEMGSAAAPHDLLERTDPDHKILHGHDDDHDDHGDEMNSPQRERPGGAQPQELTGRARELAEYFDRATQYMANRAAQPPKVDRDVRLEAMIPYLKGEKLVLLHCRAASGIRNAVGFAKKYRLKVALVGVPDAWKEAKLLADNKIPVIINPAGRVTLGANSTVNDYDPYDTPYVLPTLLERAGVKYGFQSNDNSLACHLGLQVGQSCAYGLTPQQALRAITLSTAEILGIERQVGSLDPGKLGNLIVTTGDLFEPTSTVKAVFIQGQPVSLTSKWTRLRDQGGARIVSTSNR